VNDIVHAIKRAMQALFVTNIANKETNPLIALK
jgi:hypothetical protein